MSREIMSTSRGRRVFAGLLLLTLNLSTLTSIAFSQRRTPAGRQTAQKQAPQYGDKAESCSGWRGKVTYVQNVNQEGFRDKGQYGYEKSAHIIQIYAEVNATGGGSSAVKVAELHKDVTDSEDRRRADCGGGLGPSRPNAFVEKYYTVFESSGQSTGSTPVNVHVDERGNYYFDISLPPAKGKQSMSGKHTQKGYCSADADNEQVTSPVEQPRQFESIRVYAEGKIDRQNPNAVKGSAHYDPDITVTWDLSKATGECDDGGLTLADLKLEQHVFPNKTDWQDVSGNTVDGNQVKITATVSNGSRKTKSGTVTIKENKSGKELTSRSVSLPPGGETKVEYIWDTNGYAWTDGGQKASDREIEAAVADDSLRQEIIVVPKPVVLVHGLWSSAEAWSNYQAYLDTYNDEWKAFPVGADPAHGRMNTGVMGTWAASNTIFQNAQELGKQIKFTQESMNAWHVDLVAHSMGGLISRFYIHSFMPTDSPDGRPYVTHLVMLGTPNEGSPCADLADGLLDPLGKRVEALKQLEPGEVAKFNSQTTNRKGVKFSILVGVFTTRTCGTGVPGDIVVPVPSAEWQVEERGYVGRIHTGLTGQRDFEFWVKPHLALGPKKASAAAGVAENNVPEFVSAPIRESLLASVDPLPLLGQTSTQYAAPHVVQSKNLPLKAGESAELSVSAAANVANGVTFLSSQNVTVSLVDGGGETIQKIEAGSPESAEMFKSFDLGGKSGNFTLRFENTGERDESVFAAVWTSTNTLNLEFVGIQNQPDGTVKLQAKLTNNGTPVRAAAVTVKADQQNTESVLFDDGKHGDGEANDGIYGGVTGKLPDGEHLIQGKAAANGMSTSAAAALSVAIRTN